MLVQVAAAGGLVTAGAVIGALAQRLRDSRRMAKGVFTRRPAAAEPTFASWLLVSKLPDPKDGGPLTSRSELIILLRPERPSEPRK